MFSFLPVFYDPSASTTCYTGLRDVAPQAVSGIELPNYKAGFNRVLDALPLLIHLLG